MYDKILFFGKGGCGMHTVTTFPLSLSRFFFMRFIKKSFLISYHINEISTFPKDTKRNPTSSPQRTLPIGIEVTYINSTITDLESSSRPTNVTFNFGANGHQLSYPQSADIVPIPINVTTGKPIVFPKDLIFTLAGNNLTVQSEFVNNGLFVHQICLLARQRRIQYPLLGK